MRRRTTLGFVVFGSILAMATTAIAYELEHIDLDSIRIGGEIGRRIDVTVNNNALVVDVDKDFLKPFQDKTAGDGFVGLGMFIDAISRLAYHTGNAGLIARKEHVVDAAIAAQEPDGYLGMMRQDSRIKDLWDVHEMSYIVLGLTSDYEFFHNQKSLDAAKKLAGYLLAQLAQGPSEVIVSDLSPEMPITGLADAFLKLSEQSGDPKYKDFCLNVLHAGNWMKPIVKGRFMPIDGHVYAYIDKVLVQLRLDPDGQNPALHTMSDNVIDFMVKGNGLTISGACGDHECWQDTQAGTSNLGETCASAYQLKFYDERMRQKPDSLMGDLMERTIYNTLFAAQSADGRKIRYYSPFEAPRVYFDVDTYCCPNNYRRGIADLPQYIVYRYGGGILVNLYTPCEVETKLASGAALRLRQETDYPTGGHVKISLNLSAKETFPVMLRIPRWCANASVSINGQPLADTPKAGSFHIIRRAWADGDVIDLDFPMEWRLVKGRQSQVGRVAIMRGPQLFGLNRGRNEGIEDFDLRLLTLDVDSVEGPTPDDTVRPGGMACSVRVWDPAVWYPGGAQRTLTLTEFADPGVEAAYFSVPNPEDPRYVNDELFAAAP